MQKRHSFEGQLHMCRARRTNVVAAAVTAPRIPDGVQDMHKSHEGIPRSRWPWPLDALWPLNARRTRAADASQASDNGKR